MKKQQKNQTSLFLKMGLILLALSGLVLADWSIETVDSDGNVGWYTSLAMDSTGHPHIAYGDMSIQGIRYAAWNGSIWDMQTVDSGRPSAGNPGGGGLSADVYSP